MIKSLALFVSSFLLIPAIAAAQDRELDSLLDMVEASIADGDVERGLAPLAMAKERGAASTSTASTIRLHELSAAICELYSGDFACVVEEMTALIAIDSARTPAYMWRGHAQRMLVQPDRAVDDFRRVLALEPMNADAWYQVAITLRFMRRFDEAHHAIDSALGLRAGNENDLFEKGEIFQQEGDLDAAREWFAKGVAMNPENARGWALIGGIHEANGRLDSALHYVEHAIRLDPTNSYYFGVGGFLLSQLGRYDDAAAIFADLVSQPNATQYDLNNYGLVLHKLGRHNEGIAFIQKSIALDSTNAYAYRNLALVLLALDEADNACEALALALDHGFTQQYGDEVLRLSDEHCAR